MVAPGRQNPSGIFIARDTATVAWKTFQIAKFKYRLKIDAYHQRLSRTVPGINILTSVRRFLTA